MKISDTGISITDRFFEAIEILRQQKRIRGLQTFTRDHNLHYGNLAFVKSHRSTSVLKPEIIAYLARDYGFSCEWLILGRGPKFKPAPSKTEESPTHDKISDACCDGNCT